jgi:hypothetical protein
MVTRTQSSNVADAIEVTFEYIATAAVYDNLITHNDHFVPDNGSIDWAAAIMIM